MIRLFGTVPGALRRWLAGFQTSAGREAASNFVVLTTAMIFCQICGLASVFLLTRHLSPSEFGIFASAQMVQRLLAILGGMGVTGVVIVEIARNPAITNNVLAAYLLVTGMASTVLLAIVGPLAVAFCPTRAEAMLLTLVAVGNIAAGLNITCILDARKRPIPPALANSAAELLALLVLAGLAAVCTLDALIVGGVFVIKWFVTTIFVGSCFVRELGNPTLMVNGNYLRMITRSSGRIVLAGVFATLPTVFGVPLLRYYASSGEAGVYAVAMWAGLALSLIMTQFLRVVHPHIAGPVGWDRRFVQRLAISLLAVLAGLIACGILCLAIAANWLLPAAYAGILPVGTLLLAAAGIKTIGDVGRFYLMTIQRESQVALTEAAGALCYLLLAVATGVGGSALGAALTLLASSLVTTMLSYWGLWRLPARLAIPASSPWVFATPAIRGADGVRRNAG